MISCHSGGYYYAYSALHATPNNILNSDCYCFVCYKSCVFILYFFSEWNDSSCKGQGPRIHVGVLLFDQIVLHV